MKDSRWSSAREGWTAKGSYGARTPVTKPVKSKRGMSKWKKKARKHKVPVPSKKAKRAKDMSTHHLHRIFRVSDHAPFKYGITKAGENRPRSQVSKCSLGIPGKWWAGQCAWTWVRRNIKGWLKARQVEMICPTRYKIVVGKCPPGMPRCL